MHALKDVQPIVQPIPDPTPELCGTCHLPISLAKAKGRLGCCDMLVHPGRCAIDHDLHCLGGGDSDWEDNPVDTQPYVYPGLLATTHKLLAANAFRIRAANSSPRPHPCAYHCANAALQEAHALALELVDCAAIADYGPDWQQDRLTRPIAKSHQPACAERIDGSPADLITWPPELVTLYHGLTVLINQLSSSDREGIPPILLRLIANCQQYHYLSGSF